MKTDNSRSKDHQPNHLEKSRTWNSQFNYSQRKERIFAPQKGAKGRLDQRNTRIVGFGKGKADLLALPGEELGLRDWPGTFCRPILRRFRESPLLFLSPHFPPVCRRLCCAPSFYYHPLETVLRQSISIVHHVFFSPQRLLTILAAMGLEIFGRGWTGLEIAGGREGVGCCCCLQRAREKRRLKSIFEIEIDFPISSRDRSGTGSSWRRRVALNPSQKMEWGLAGDSGVGAARLQGLSAFRS